MDFNHTRPSQQLYTDENGVNYSRNGSAAPWVQISPHRQSTVHHAHTQGHVFGAMSQNSPYTIPRPPSVNPKAAYTPSVSCTPAVIDPALLPPSTLPAIEGENDDEDLPPADMLGMLASVAHPATKTAGARHPELILKGKSKVLGKRKAVSSAGSETTGKRSRGRTSGAANNNADDIWGLLAIVQERLPIGGNAWNSCADEYNRWAEESDRPVRTSKSLEAKFKQLVKTTKPTGDAEMPDYVERAHEIEDAINEKAGTRDLDDEDIADEVVEVSSDEEDAPRKLAPPKKPFVKKEPLDSTGPIARRVTSDRISQRPNLSRRSNSGPELIANLSAVFDPSAQAARQEERSARTFQASQLFSMSSQLREAQNLVESLRTRLADSDRECNAAERRADRAEMLTMVNGMHGGPRRWSNIPAPNRTPTRAVRHDVFYKDGGQAVRWIAPGDEEPLYPDSPGTRSFARYTPECPPTFASQHTQCSPSARSPSFQTQYASRNTQSSGYSPEPQNSFKLSYSRSSPEL